MYMVVRVSACVYMYMVRANALAKLTLWPFECGGVELISLVCGVLTCMHVHYIGIRVRVSFSSNETKTRGGTLALCCGASTLQA